MTIGTRLMKALLIQVVSKACLGPIVSTVILGITGTMAFGGRPQCQIPTLSTHGTAVWTKALNNLLETCSGIT